MKQNRELKNRKLKFTQNIKSIKLKNIKGLVGQGRIDNIDLLNLQNASKVLLNSSLYHNKKKKLNIYDKNFLKKISDNNLHNITHNGLVVPKKEITAEYNLFIKMFNTFIINSKLNKIVKFFIGPPQIRLKNGLKKKKYRFNSSEYPHSDAWTYLNPKNSLTLFFPIMGDAKKNCVEFFFPNKNFSNNWLKKRYFNEQPKDILKNYKKIKIKYNIGDYIIADTAIFHQSITKKNAGPRLSIDIGIIPKSEKKFKKLKNYIKADTINKIGTKKLFIFKTPIEQKIKNYKSGTKTMENRVVLKI